MNKKQLAKTEFTCYFAILLVLLISLLLTACTNNSSNKSSTETSANTEEPTEEVFDDIEEIVEEESTEEELDVVLSEESAEEELEFEEVLDDKEEFADEVLADIEEKPVGEVFKFADEYPEFPGGEEGLKSFIKNNLRYPASCAEEGIEGRVTVTFVIAKDGSVKGFEVLRSKDDRLSNEAKRIVATMPKWKPGNRNGEEINVSYLLPITFRLQ